MAADGDTTITRRKREGENKTRREGKSERNQTRRGEDRRYRHLLLFELDQESVRGRGTDERDGERKLNEGPRGFGLDSVEHID